MQVQKHDGFINRIVSYNARQLASQLKRGQYYTTLKEAISLVIVDFPLFDDSDDFSEHILFRRENRKNFTKVQQFYIIDLTKLPQTLTESKHQWGALFKAKTEEELKVLMKDSEEMREAGEKLLALNADEEAQEIAALREMSQWAWQHTLHATEKRVREEAQAKSEAEKLEIVKKLKMKNMSNEEIFEITGISLEEIERNI